MRVGKHHCFPPVILIIGFWLLAAVTFAGEPRPQQAKVQAAIDRGISFLQRDALAWKKEHNCVSCHHAALVVWSMREARQMGHTVDEQVLKDLTQWLAESGDGKTSLPRPDGIPKALNAKAVWFALALAADKEPDTASKQELKLLRQTVKSDQTDNGSWAAWPETRPPIFGKSDESMTVLAALALLSASGDGDTEARAACEKAVKSLSEMPSDDDPQSIAMRLVLWAKLGRGSNESIPLAKRIIERQRDDGGWSQAPEMASDAWATGQALYALAHAGLESNKAVIARGRAFLINTQREDGSWPMTSRPTKPGEEGAKSLIPITGAGSAWAVLGLVRSSSAITSNAANPPVP